MDTNVVGIDNDIDMGSSVVIESFSFIFASIDVGILSMEWSDTEPHGSCSVLTFLVPTNNNLL